MTAVHGFQARVRDAMHAGVVTCAPGTPLGEVAAVLRANRIHAVVVAGDLGEPLGVVADTDLLSGEWLATDTESFATMRSLTAADLMSSPALTVDADRSLGAAAAQMRASRVARLLVLEGREPVGVLALSDLLAFAAREMPIARRTVSDVMSWGFVCCSPETPPREAARSMVDRRTRSLVVVDPEGRAVGLVTQTDVLDALLEPHPAETLAEIMNPPITIGEHATLDQAADAMLRHEIHRLLVLREGDAFPIGLISTSDVVAEMAGRRSAWREPHPAH